MRLSELSERSGVPVATIKYYLREGLLPPGEAVSATRSEYGQEHLRRLRLVRALVEVGQLPIASIRRVLAAADDEHEPLHLVLGTALYALSPRVEPAADDPEWERAESDVNALLGGLGWRVDRTAPARGRLAQAVMTLRRLGHPVSMDDLRSYAESAARRATTEIGSLPADAGRLAMVEAVVVRSVLYDQVALAFRHLAQENESAHRPWPHLPPGS
ncbi:MerR family transcriptional regulator [Bailinhaonella thermotolerans]|uniref:MerR family transcriptional regulator n=1 Tax=Bailinhaonella thermotolerans TaxID=1070861 RepID=A0A3A4AA50_9ACTN|nr:MerR family transcriptional regulator [Bailinhaonella thermotolerans]RJL25061.1 MerR family transcriptional regulator [Bailinhaonella thermotolerans]